MNDRVWLSSLNNGVRYCLLSFVLICSSTVFARPYVIAGLADYPPYSYQENLVIRGMNVEIAKAAFHRAGHEVDIVLMPWKRLLSSARSGAVDGTLGAFITDERRVYLDFIEPEPLRWIQMSLFTYDNSAITNSHLSSLQQRKIGVNRAFSINADFDHAAMRGDFQRYAGNDIHQMLKMLSLHRLDGVVHSKQPTLFYLREMGLIDKIHLVEPAVTKRRGGFMSLSKALIADERASLKLALQKAMQEMKADGTLQAIRLKHSVIVKTPTITEIGR